jgi:hypothetical protein
MQQVCLKTSLITFRVTLLKMRYTVGQAIMLLHAKEN